MGRLAVVGTLVLAAIGGGCGASSHRQAAPRPQPGPAVAPVDARPASNLRGRIAYGGSDGHLWVLDAATGGRTQVTGGGGGNDFDPHWSPDGNRLVFRSMRFTVPDPYGIGLDGIVVIGADGTGERVISPPEGGLFPDWSPDGSTIVFSTATGRTSTWSPTTYRRGNSTTSVCTAKAWPGRPTAPR